MGDQWQYTGGHIPIHPSNPAKWCNLFNLPWVYPRTSKKKLGELLFWWPLLGEKNRGTEHKSLITAQTLGGVVDQREPGAWAFTHGAWKGSAQIALSRPPSCVSATWRRSQRHSNVHLCVSAKSRGFGQLIFGCQNCLKGHIFFFSLRRKELSTWKFSALSCCFSVILLCILCTAFWLHPALSDLSLSKFACSPVITPTGILPWLYLPLFLSPSTLPNVSVYPLPY